MFSLTQAVYWRVSTAGTSVEWPDASLAVRDGDNTRTTRPQKKQRPDNGSGAQNSIELWDSNGGAGRDRCQQT